MKTLFLTVLILLFSLCSIAQLNTVTVNTLNKETAKQRTVFMNPDFIKGKIVFKDEAYAEPPMNYNRLTGQLLFLTPRGDTLALSKPETTAYVVIGNDTLGFHDNTFLVKVTHYGTMPNLYARNYMKYIGKEKKGPYGTYSTLSAANSNSTYTYDDQSTQYISIDENLIYKPQTEYFLSDPAAENFYPAGKKGFYKAFPQHEKKLKEFLESYRPDYSSKDDLLQVFKYVQRMKP